MEINGRSALGIRILVVLVAPLILYWQDLLLLANEALNSDLSSHILAIPFLMTYLFYRVRKTFAASSSNLLIESTKKTGRVSLIVGALLCSLAYLLFWFGSYTFQPLEYHVASLPIFVAGMVLIIFNERTLKTLLFPILFLIFLIPPPMELTEYAGSALSVFSSRGAYAILRMLSFPVNLLNRYGSPVIFLTSPSGVEMPFTIDVACSGLYSLMGFTLFAVFTAYISRGSLLKKLSVLSLGFPLIYVLNILRITLIVIIGYYSGFKLALNVFHLIGGWTLTLLGTLILLTAAEKIFKISIFGVASENCPQCDERGAESYCLRCGRIIDMPQSKFLRKDLEKIIPIFLIIVSLLFIQVPVFALTEGASEIFTQKITGEASLKNVLPEVEGYELRFVYRDVAFENISGQDASLMYQYLPTNPYDHIVWVGIEIAPAMIHLHRWERCLIGYPMEHGGQVQVTQLDLRDIHLLDNPPISARYFAYQRRNSNYTQVILYWYTNSIFKTEIYQQKWTKISVICIIDEPESYMEIENEILPVASEIANYWQPLRRWSWTALAIARSGQTLLFLPVILIIVTITYYFNLEINKRKSARKIFLHLSNIKEKNILEVIKSLNKNIANGYNISEKYKEVNVEEIDLEAVSTIFFQALESGLVETKIINRNDEPYVTWRANF